MKTIIIRKLICKLKSIKKMFFPEYVDLKIVFVFVNFTRYALYMKNKHRKTC